MPDNEGRDPASRESTVEPGRTLWRISNFSELNGAGGLVSPGRWHRPGHRVVYLADSPSTALLETLVHLELEEDDYPDPRKLLEVWVPQDCQVIDLPIPAETDWSGDLDLTQRLGSEWLRGLVSPLAAVPSAVVAEARNFLLNPLHPDARRIKIVSERVQRFDKRLFKFVRHGSAKSRRE